MRETKNVLLTIFCVKEGCRSWNVHRYAEKLHASKM